MRCREAAAAGCAALRRPPSAPRRRPACAPRSASACATRPSCSPAYLWSTWLPTQVSLAAAACLAAPLSSRPARPAPAGWCGLRRLSCESHARRPSAGNTALEAAHRVGAAGRVVGVDVADSMHGRAERKASAQGLANVAFRQARATARARRQGRQCPSC